VNLDRAHLETGQAADVVGDALAQRGGHLGEVEPVLDDDVEVNLHAATVRNRVSYEVGRMTSLEVAAVEVHIEAVKVSA